MVSSIQQVLSICFAPGRAQQEESKMKPAEPPLLEGLKGLWKTERQNWQQGRKCQWTESKLEDSLLL